MHVEYGKKEEPKPGPYTGARQALDKVQQPGLL